VSSLGYQEIHFINEYISEIFYKKENHNTKSCHGAHIWFGAEVIATTVLSAAITIGTTY
jgi:hypothetical protein